MRPVWSAVVLVALALAGSMSVRAQTLDDVLNVRKSTTEAGRRSQAKIDQLSDQTRDLLTQYKQVMKVVDGLKVYNRQQEGLIRQQENEITDLNNSIDNVTVVERQMSPLIERMIDNLAKFIDLDKPFLLKERRDRIAFLRDVLDRADVTVSEKFSQVLQAYQIENTYGSTIEAYTDVIDVQGKSRQVDVLKWGRATLVFQTPDAEITGVWDNKARTWVTLGDDYRADVRNALRIARKTATADMVRLPFSAPETSR